MHFLLPSERIDGKKIQDKIKHTYICPTCKGCNTTKKEHDTEWVACPLLKSSKKYICLGCCAEIGSACRDEEAHKRKGDERVIHWDLDVIGDAVKSTGRSAEEVRLICLKHQLGLIESRPGIYTTSDDMESITDMQNVIKTMSKKKYTGTEE